MSDHPGDLPSLLHERTAQLQAANAELESFTYSISHDLRAAIRGMVACSQIVIEDHSAGLTEEGKRWLDHIHDDAIRLDSFTAALLELSRLSRATLAPSAIDMSELAESVSREVAARYPDRAVEFRAAAGMMSQGDPVLIRTLVTNLLDNAWKFTRGTSGAVAEFGRAPVGNDEAFFIRDNGAGFDPARAERLFGPFQRLHQQTEFPGLGIGLAVVRRIVHRHGGRVWAEGTPGKGATLFFTLGEPVG